MDLVVPPTSYHRYKDVVFPTSFSPQLRRINLHTTPLTANFYTLLTGFGSTLESLYGRFYDWRYRRWLQAGALLWTVYYISRFLAFFRLTPNDPATWSFGLLAAWWLILLGLSLTKTPLPILHYLTSPALLLTAWTVVQVNYQPWLMGHYESSIPQILGPFVITTLTFGLPFRHAVLISITQAIVMIGACWAYGIPLRVELLGTLTLALVALLFFNMIQEQQARSEFLNRLTIYNLVTSDGLTGIANRSYFTEQLDQALKNHVPVVLMMFDVDNFKGVNDTYGHAAGDNALRMVGAVLAQAAGENGVAGRFGGEEFALFLTGTDYLHATALADEIRNNIRTTLIPREHGSFRITVSGGVIVAAPPHAVTVEALLHRADDLMYRAKDEGRNRIVQGS